MVMSLVGLGDFLNLVFSYMNVNYNKFTSLQLFLRLKWLQAYSFIPANNRRDLQMAHIPSTIKMCHSFRSVLDVLCEPTCVSTFQG